MTVDDAGESPTKEINIGIRSTTESPRPLDSTKAEKLFDRKFVTAAVIIGIAYALLMAALGSLLGKEAAGVAGVSLSAVATGIFKQFESLRFKQLSEAEEILIKVPKLKKTYLILLAFGIVGIQFVSGVVLAAAVQASGLLEKGEEPITAWFTFVGSPKGLASLFLLNVASYFVGGWLCGRTAPSMRYSYAMITTLAVVIFNLLIPLLQDVPSSRQKFIEKFGYMAIGGIVSLFYLVVSLLGARLGFRGRVFRYV